MISVSVFSQGREGFYAYLQSGYKLGSVYTTFPNENIIFNNNVSNHYIRLGGGATFTGSVGWMLHKNLGFEVSTTYTSGTNKTITDDNFIEKFKSKNIHSVGSIVAQFPIKNFFVYAKAGVVIGYYNKTDLYYYDPTFGSNLSYGYRLNAEIMRGYNGSLGVLLPISKSLQLMIEAEEVSIQGSFDKATLVDNNTGISIPSQVQFLENISSAVSTQDIVYARKYPVSYSCIGVNIGLHYTFKMRK